MILLEKSNLSRESEPETKEFWKLEAHQNKTLDSTGGYAFF